MRTANCIFYSVIIDITGDSYYSRGMQHKRTIQQLCIVGLFAFFFILVLRMLSPFFSVLLWAILLYVLLNPLHKRALALCKSEKKFFEIKRHFLAAAFAIATISLVIGPLVFLSILLAKQLVSFLGEIETVITQNPQFFSLNSLERFITELISTISFGSINIENFDLYKEFTQLIQRYSASLFQFGTHIAGNIGYFGFSLVLMLFALYFFYLDGQYLASLFSRAVPINPGQMSELISKFAEITRHLFSGYILVALYQGIASFILMSIFGIKGALLFSVTLMFCSFIPLFGAATVWLPVGIALCLNNPLWQGILFLVLSAVCISFLDNFLRPFFLKDRIQVHPLIIFFSILGGLAMFGFNGLILGPMIIILFFTILDMVVNAGETT